MREIRAGSLFSEVAADFLAEALDLRLRAQPRASLALSGGSTPWAAFRRLAKADIDWSRVDVYQVDERIAPAGDPARNLTGLTEAFIGHVLASSFPMPVEAEDLDAAAAKYASQLPEVLDVVHLGLGDDGHTASLVPGDPVLDVVDRRVAVTQLYRGHRRMTLTFPVLSAAAHVVWLVSSAGKESVLQQLRDGDASIPAGRIERTRAVLITDELSDS